jgi:3-carboxy-cis,cis-muconate cycloisomerase
MLRFEAALAAAEARAGVIPEEAADAIARRMRPRAHRHRGARALGRQLGTPVAPLAQELRGRIEPRPLGGDEPGRARHRDHARRP